MNKIPKSSPHRLWSRLLLGAAVIGALAAPAPVRAQQIMNWTFYPGKSGTATNGTVIDSFSASDGSGTTIDTLNANANSTDLYLSYNGVTGGYGAYNQFGSRNHFWAYNYPGQTGPITITVTPYLVVDDWYATPHDTYSSTVQIDFSVTTLKNGTAWDRRQYSTALQGRTDLAGIHILTDAMTPATIAFNDGDDVQFNLSHQISLSANAWMTQYGKSQAWYTAVVSANGYLTPGPRFPNNPPLPDLAPPQVTATAVTSSTDASTPQVTVSGTGGPANAPLTYYVLTATNAAMPLSNWAPCLTNRFDTNGTFSFTMSVSTNEPQRFFRLLLTQH